MIHLHLIRHAKTEKISYNGIDFDRKLTSTGIIQANILRTKLESIGINVDHVLISSAKRTQQTAEIILSAINFRTRKDDPVFYLAETEQLLKELNTLDVKSVMLIGHNDGLTDLVRFLTGENNYLRPADYTCIQLPVSSWEYVSQGIGTILTFLHQDVVLPSE